MIVTMLSVFWSLSRFPPTVPEIFSLTEKGQTSHANQIESFKN